jgi:hypothetical protein
MGRRGETAETLTIVLELLRLIPRRVSITAAELERSLAHRGHQRDLRSIQRLLQMLSDLGVIDCDRRSRPYAYRAKGSTAPFHAASALTPQEALLLKLARDHLGRVLPPHVLEGLAPFFEQARLELGPDRDAREARWLAKVSIDSTSQPLLAPPVDGEVLRAVATALYEERWLRLTYRNKHDREHPGEVQPLGLIQQGERLYLVALYEGRSEPRHLALHRIRRAEVLEHRFRPPASFDLRQHIGEGRLDFGTGRKIKLTFSIDPEAGKHLLESKLSHDQTVKTLRDGWLRITATVYENERLWRWLRGFGGDVRAISDMDAQ